MLVAGLDEAGRGPVIGSLVIGCVLIEEDRLPALKEQGITDSKQLSPKRREQLVDTIKSASMAWRLVELSAHDLNTLHAKNLTLNEIEEMAFGQALNEIEPKPAKIYLDAADVKEERFGQSVARHLKFIPGEIISKHKGDALFTVVGAASILAKTRRDQIIEGFKAEYGDIGSGYPSDPYTIKYLKQYYQDHKEFPPIVRTWWETAKKIARDFKGPGGKSQKKLTDFTKSR